MKFLLPLPTVHRPPVKGGGYYGTLQFAGLLKRRAEVQMTSYREEEPGVWYLPKEAERFAGEGYILMLNWGPDVTALIREYGHLFFTAYYMHGINWGVQLPPEVPILCRSRYLLAYAQEHFPANPEFYLPPALDSECKNIHGERDIDVLVLTRKLSDYILETLVPELSRHCHVHVVDQFIPPDELYALYNRSKVYLYAFAPMRTDLSPTGWRMMEGFGQQVLEAMACGCTVFSNMRGGMMEVVDPWMHGYRLESHSPAWDIRQVLRAVEKYPQTDHILHEQVLQAYYSEAAFLKRIDALLEFLSEYVPFAAAHAPSPDDFSFPHRLTPVSRAKERVRNSLTLVSEYVRTARAPLEAHRKEYVTQRAPAD